MRWLLFLSRLAFLCGLFFLLAISLQVRGMEGWIRDETVASHIITIGVFMGMLIVPVTSLCYAVVGLWRKKPGVPGWLIFANLFFLFAMICYIFLLQ